MRKHLFPKMNTFIYFNLLIFKLQQKLFLQKHKITMVAPSLKSLIFL